MNVRDTQLQCIRDMTKECQLIIARLDELMFKIKALSAIIWSALASWAITKDKSGLLIIATFALFGLWIVAAAFRGAQKRYIRFSDALHKFLTNNEQLVNFEPTGILPNGVPASLGGCEPRVERGKLWLIGLISPTVSLFYLFFIFVSITSYYFIK